MWEQLWKHLDGDDLPIAKRVGPPRFNILRFPDRTISFGMPGTTGKLQYVEFIEVEHDVYKLTDVWPIVNGIICPFMRFSDLPRSVADLPQARPVEVKS